MKTINKFTEGDLDSIIGAPLLELCEEFTTFNSTNLAFSVEKRTKILVKITPYKTKEISYFLGGIGESIPIGSNRIKSESQMIDKLNNSTREYRLATTEEIKFIYIQMHSWMKDVLVYEKI